MPSTVHWSAGGPYFGYRQMTHDEYVRHDAVALAALHDSGEVTAREIAEIAVERIERVNPLINAVVHRMDDEAMAAVARTPPEGVFAGVPFLAKDLIGNYAGHPTSQGSRFLDGTVAESDTELARRVRATGVSVLGKTNVPEFGLLPCTEPLRWGPCRNPWDLDRTPGGSSGGAAAAVAAGIVPIAGAGDGAGSIRIPASCCGLFGLKPTRGRVPSRSSWGTSWRGAVVEHVLTRSVRDSAAMLDATHGPDRGARYRIRRPRSPYLREIERDPKRLRIYWTTEPTLGDTVHPECVEGVARARVLLEDLGHDVVEGWPQVNRSSFAMAFMRVVIGELGAEVLQLAEWVGRRPRRGELEPLTRCLTILASAVSAREYADSLRALDRHGYEIAGFLGPSELLLGPSVASPPPRIGALGPQRTERLLLRALGAIGSGRLVRLTGLIERIAESAFDFTPWSPLFNVSGQPAMSVPLHWSGEGLPVGVQLAAPVGDEATLLRLAAQLERARPWFNRIPLGTFERP